MICSNEIDKLGICDVHIACNYGIYDEVLSIISVDNSKVNLRTLEGYCPLFYACGNNFCDIAKLLVMHGADVDFRYRCRF
jgi:ankyrin repeat protein